jgi:DNA-binding MarR family transcriptional regulator
VHLFDSHPLRGAFLANTLERLASLIVAQGEELLRDAGLTIPARAASTILLLGERTRMSAADLARTLGQPHQLVTQRVNLLIELGIVSRAGDSRDARRRILALTARGRKEFETLRAQLILADAAFAALSAEIGCNLAEAATSAIAALERSPVRARVRAHGTRSRSRRRRPEEERR